jgi:hypothetical protein
MTEDQLHDILNQELAKFAGQIMHHVDSKVDELRQELKTDIANVNQNIDSLAKRLDDDAVERAAITAQLDRHERWHHQTADALHLTLEY